MASFNTASGMYVLQLSNRKGRRLAIIMALRFNTASGMYVLQHLESVTKYLERRMFQYRKRYVRVATACLEKRPQTGLVWHFGKPAAVFANFARFSHEHR